MWRSTCLAATQNKPICKFPCLLHLLPARLKWRASLSPLSLSSVFGKPVSDYTQESLKELANTKVLMGLKSLSGDLKAHANILY